MTEQRKAEGTTRRDFIKTAAAGAAVAAANLSLLGNVHAAGSDTIKVGIIGCGGRGGGAGRDVLQAAPNVQIVAIGDVFKFRVNETRDELIQMGKSEAAKKLSNSVDLPEDRCFVGIDCHERVINAPGVNYVILATPPGFRP